MAITNTVGGTGESILSFANKMKAALDRFNTNESGRTAYFPSEDEWIEIDKVVAENRWPPYYYDIHRPSGETAEAFKARATKMIEDGYIRYIKAQFGDLKEDHNSSGWEMSSESADLIRSFFDDFCYPVTLMSRIDTKLMVADIIDGNLSELVFYNRFCRDAAAVSSEQFSEAMSVLFDELTLLSRGDRERIRCLIENVCQKAEKLPAQISKWIRDTQRLDEASLGTVEAGIRNQQLLRAVTNPDEKLLKLFKRIKDDLEALDAKSMFGNNLGPNEEALLQFVRIKLYQFEKDGAVS